MPHPVPDVQILTRLTVGALLGLLVGYEREWRGRPAGLHTCGLVATGAAAFAAIAPALGSGTGDRVIANIVTGVGFLAGGVILREGMNVSGLNTAATIWATAAVGAFAGVGLFREAAAVAVAILAINILMDPLSAALNARIERAKARRSNQTS